MEYFIRQEIYRETRKNRDKTKIVFKPRRLNIDGEPMINGYFLENNQIKSKPIPREWGYANETSLTEREFVINDAYEVNLLLDTYEEYLYNERDFSIVDVQWISQQKRFNDLIEILEEIAKMKTPLRIGAKLRLLQRKHPTKTGYNACKIWAANNPELQKRLDEYILNKRKEKQGTK